MNTFGRTKSNKERLKLKSFFKRTLLSKVISKILPLKLENSRKNGIENGMGSDNMHGEKYSFITYYVKFQKKWKTHNKEVRFKKQQLIGKIYYEFGYKCTIIKKVA